MSAKVSDKAIRIALLLREATVLDAEHWDAFAGRAGLKESKTAWEILNQDASLQTFREFLFLDLKTLIPGRSTSAELHMALGAPVRIYAGELAYVLRNNQPDVARLCHSLISHNLMSEPELAAALEKAERNALNVYDVLVAQELITPAIIEKAVANNKSEFAFENRATIAGDILMFNSLLTREDFARALESRAVTKTSLARTFEQLKILTQEDLYSAMESGLELPTVELLTTEISQPLMERFPREFMRRQLFIPLAIQDHALEIGTADPFNLALADTIAMLTGMRVSMTYTPHSDLLAKFERLFPANEVQPTVSIPPMLPPRAAKTQPAAAQAPASSAGDSGTRVPDFDFTRRAPAEPFVDNLSTVQLVSQIMEAAISARATDIHIEPLADSVRIRYRVDGELHNVMKVPQDMMLSVASRIKVLAGMNVTERRRPQDGRFSLDAQNRSYDFRISTLPSVHGEKVVLRVLDSSRVLTGLPQLGLEPIQMQALERLISRPHGLILVTGPTGSGKTSTLYACLSTVQGERNNIITIEDPVEYQLDGITQVQVDQIIDLTFANGLRSALRQDPDIIMVGEIRDSDTAHAAIRAALTGHLVFSTLHTNTAVGAMSALVHMGIPRYLIASALTGIVAQRLVRVICPACKTTATVSRGVLEAIGLGTNTRKRFARGNGCGECFNTGFVGRTGVFEVVELSEELRAAIVEGMPEREMQEIAARRNPPLEKSALSKVLQGITTPAEALRAVEMR